MHLDDQMTATAAIKNIAESTSMDPQKIIVHVVLGAREPISLQIDGEPEGQDEIRHTPRRIWQNGRLPYRSELEKIAAACGMRGFDACLTYTPSNSFVLLEHYQRPPLPTMEVRNYRARILAISSSSYAFVRPGDFGIPPKLVANIACDLKVGESIIIGSHENSIDISQHGQEENIRTINNFLSCTMDYQNVRDIINEGTNFVLERLENFVILSAEIREKKSLLLVVGCEYALEEFH